MRGASLLAQPSKMRHSNFVYRRRTLVPALLVPLALAFQVAGTNAAPKGGPPACRGVQLSGSFTRIAGSAGAGQISYALRLRNHSSATCFVSGLPSLQLLDRSGKRLPTHVTPAFPGAGTAARIFLVGNASAWAEARFSPDVPGVGEPVAGKMCERTAYRVIVGAPPSSSTLIAPIRPPTPVCEHGAMHVSLLGKKRPTA